MDDSGIVALLQRQNMEDELALLRLCFGVAGRGQAGAFRSARQVFFHHDHLDRRAVGQQCRLATDLDVARPAIEVLAAARGAESRAAENPRLWRRFPRPRGSRGRRPGAPRPAR
jgi:hypothetical protein